MRADPLPKEAGKKAGLLYETGARIQPRRAHGRFQRLRDASMLLLLGAYYLIPWLSWNGNPLVWFDLPHRRFHLAWLTLAPQDLILLSALLFVAALTLFFFTSLAGRLWCGYACPQTVWTEAFLWIEHLIEGDRHSRMKLDRAPWGPAKIVKRGGKHLAWIAFGLFTGLTFVAYFVPARELFPAALSLQLGGWSLFWTLFYGFATWGNAGFMREQVCKYMCPYARFQSAMFDRDTLIIAYDDKRGEPRKGLVRKAAAAARTDLQPTITGSPLSLGGARDAGAPPVATAKLAQGDCIDCSLCVQVCPVGIDIRKGLQYECIACAACVDACDSVMDAVHKPRGLVHYTTAHRDSGKTTHLLRPRTIGYGLVWIAACIGLVVLVLTHSPVRFDVLRDRHTLVRERADGSLENLYVFKLTNGDDRVHSFRVEAQFADGTALTPSPATIAVAAGATTATPVILRTPPVAENAQLEAVTDVRIRLTSEEDADLTVDRDARFLTHALH